MALRGRQGNWLNRVSIFRTYRASGKVMPTANQHKVARSTVRVVLREFASAGFSLAPRLRLSHETLVALQERHLAAVWQMRDASPFTVADPKANRLFAADHKVPLEQGESLSESPLRSALTSKGYLQWHLEGKETIRLGREAATAIEDYDRGCTKLWLDIRASIEHSCNLNVEPEPDDLPDTGTHLWACLVDLVYDDLFGDALPDPEEWFIRPGSDLALPVPRFLEVRHHKVAVSDSEDDLGRIRKDMKQFLEHNTSELRSRAADLTWQYRDLEYLTSIVIEAMAKVTEEDIAAGVCPACPYPEYQEKPPKRRRRSAKP